MTASQPKPQLAASLLGQTPAVVERRGEKANGGEPPFSQQLIRVYPGMYRGARESHEHCAHLHGERERKYREHTLATTHHALQSDGPRLAHHYPLPTICSPDTLLDKEISPASILTILSILSILSVTANRFSLRQQMLCSLRALAQLSGNTAL